jgi:hypothetical protein
MATNFLWGGVGSVIHLLTTEMNSLAVSTLTAYGPEINNSTGYQFGQLYLHLASAAFVAGNAAAVYFVPSNDTAGGTYPTLTSATAAGLGNYLAGIIQINGSTAAQDEILRNVNIPLGKFKTVLQTLTGTPSLAATLNTLDLYPTPTQY